jgi:hypothetical protein
MMEQTSRLLGRYAKRGVLVDANILLLYLIGSYDRSLIPRFKRTRQFTVEDYATLLLLLRPFEAVITTPNILTEVSNLSGQLVEPARSDHFRMFAERIRLMDEHYIDSREAAAQEGFVRFGVTDMGILLLSRNRYLVLTDDFRLSQFLQHNGVDVINFNHIRPLGWT